MNNNVVVKITVDIFSPGRRYCLPRGAANIRLETDDKNLLADCEPALMKLLEAAITRYKQSKDS